MQETVLSREHATMCSTWFGRAHPQGEDKGFQVCKHKMEAGAEALCRCSPKSSFSSAYI